MKKGMFEIATIVSMILLVFILVIFLVFFAIPRAKAETNFQSELGSSEGDILLMNILRTPVGDGEFVDLIINEEYELAKEKGEEFIPDLLLKSYGNSMWGMDIVDPSGATQEIKTNPLYDATYDIIIPGKEEDISVFLRVGSGKQLFGGGLV